MSAFNNACNYISYIAFNNANFSKFNIQKLCYYYICEKYKLPTQLAIRAISKVAQSYKADKKKLHTFKQYGAVVYDQRNLTLKDNCKISIGTLLGHELISFVNYYKQLLVGKHICGQTGLILSNNIFYLILSVETSEAVVLNPKDYIGVDLGIVNIAVDSTGEVLSGSKLNSIRKRHNKLRQKLQAKGTKSAKYLLKKRSKKEKSFAKDINHIISKKIVLKAKGTQCGIALEDLKGIRTRTEKTVKKAQRLKHFSWAFYQLRQFIEYKAKIVGVPIVFVDPRNTSRTCTNCDCIDKRNRKTRNEFICVACRYFAPADNIAY